ncbi:MAG: hypothetical protein ACYTGQ_00805 [Planctomycetota bacterium]|jgi:hypothetical protein
MNNQFFATCLLGIVLAGGMLIATATSSVNGADTSAPVVGVFDSRAVAAAWIRSDAHGQSLQEMKAEYDRAKAAGNDKRLQELDKQGRQSQELAHEQVFGNEPIDNVLEIIEDQLPDIAKKAGAGVLVSKWEIAYQDGSMKTVDVTWDLVKLFDPDDKTVETIKQVMKSKPVKDVHH